MNTALKWLFLFAAKMLFCSAMQAQNHYLVWQDFVQGDRVLIDSDGREIANIPSKYNSAIPMYRIDCFAGSAAVLTIRDEDSKSFYLLDTLGHLSKSFDDLIINFEGDYGIIRNAENKTAIINNKGEITGGWQYDQMTRVSEGLTAFRDGKQYGYMDVTGKIVIAAQFKRAWDFQDAKAKVETEEGISFINKNGELLFPALPEFQASAAGEKYCDGLQLVRQKGKALSEPQYGYLDEQGELAIPIEFEFARSFSEGYAVIRSDQKTSYINTQGEPAFKQSFLMGTDFEHGVARVRDIVSNMFGVIGTDGEYILKPKYLDHTIHYSDGQILACEKIEQADTTAIVGASNPEAKMQAYLFDRNGQVVYKFPPCRLTRKLAGDLLLVQYGNLEKNNYEILRPDGSLVWRPDAKHIHFKSLERAASFPKEEVRNLDFSIQGYQGGLNKQAATLDSRIFEYPNLRSLILDDRHMRIPDRRIASLSTLEELHLKSCGIESLPDEILQLKNLKVLNLEWNYKLKQLPEGFISAMQQLEVLNIANCGFDADLYYKLKQELPKTKVIIKRARRKEQGERSVRYAPINQQ